MDLRERTHEHERNYLSDYAAQAAASQGRVYPEADCEIRTAFQRDRDRILHSKAFRRLKTKTQVFIAPEGDHYRTRMTHTLEVSQISRTIARSLRLNEDLVEAIALGHDLGHTPFGHAGEACLNELCGSFLHNEQSLRVVEQLETHTSAFPGLNLTQEVRDGILGHTGPWLPPTLEGQLVRICDRVAYLNHDIDDSVRGCILAEDDLPQIVRTTLGCTRRERIDVMVKDIIRYSLEQPSVSMSPAVEKATDELRTFLFANVYVGSAAKLEESRVYNVLTLLFQHYQAHPEELRQRLNKPYAENETSRSIVDFIAGMSDSYAISEFNRLFLPRSWSRV